MHCMVCVVWCVLYWILFWIVLCFVLYFALYCIVYSVCSVLYVCIVWYYIVGMVGKVSMVWYGIK